jgi:hypothetical protein
LQQQIQQMGQALQEAESGMAVKRMEIESRERIEAARIESAERIAAENSDVKRDVAELAGVVQLLLQKMQPPPALAAEVAKDLGETPDDSQPLAG